MRLSNNSTQLIERTASEQAEVIADEILISNELDERIVSLIELLQKIDTTNPEAIKNSISIDDNNGGRILL